MCHATWRLFHEVECAALKYWRLFAQRNCRFECSSRILARIGRRTWSSRTWLGRTLATDVRHRSSPRDPHRSQLFACSFNYMHKNIWGYPVICYKSDWNRLFPVPAVSVTLQIGQSLPVLSVLRWKVFGYIIIINNLWQSFPAEIV